ncbi:MAG TPA: transporter [Thermoanaerobaculia bacterium]
MRSSRRVLILLLTLVLAFSVFARVGGGDSYGGGSSSSGSGSGGGGGGDGSGELIWLAIRFLFWLTIEHPLIGIPVDIIVITFVVRWLRRRERNTVLSFETEHAPVVARAPSIQLDELRRFDPNFSNVTFHDFCYSLYGRAQQARGAGTLDQYAPYLSADARRALQSRNPKGLREVNGIIIGSFSVTAARVAADAKVVIAQVTYESNYTEISNGGAMTWYVREQWILERERDILSPPPEKAKADHCPRCGAALRTRTDGACEFCGAKIETGAFQWYVRAISLLDRQERGPVLTGGGVERGTNLPTILQPRLLERLTAAGDVEAFLEHVRRVAIELQNAWTSRDWERVRPLETEGLFQMHRYWIDAYRKQKLRNVVDDYQIDSIEPVKFDSDAFYEALTVRIYARGRDYTVDENGTVVGGSKNVLNAWSEYWTFIRTRKAGAGKMACPNCGANVAVGTTGVCEYCGGKLTSGTFDWVLSRIEQDEAYTG